MAIGAVACCGGKMKTHKKCIFFIIIGIIYSLVPLFGENKEEFHTKTVIYSEGTLELYAVTMEGRTSPDYNISFTEEGDNWMTIDIVIFSNPTDEPWFDSVQLSLAKKVFTFLEEMADNNGFSQTLLDMKCDYHFIFIKNNLININNEKTALVKYYYYDPFAEYEEGR